MKKSQIITIIIIIVVIITAIVVFVFGKREMELKPLTEIATNVNPVNAVDSTTKKTSSFDELKNEILGNKDDLVSFSILPNSKVHDVVSFRGVIKGGYFFEGNILVNILDINKEILKKGNAHSVGEWMTAGPVDFEGFVDFSKLTNGLVYIEIKNDNVSDDRTKDKSILIPVFVE